MESFAQTAINTPPASGQRRFEHGLSPRELGRLGVPSTGFEGVKEVITKEIFQFSASNIGREKAKTLDRRPGFLALGAPLGKPEGDHNVKALSADGVVGAALSLITLAVVALTYIALKSGDFLFSPPDFTALFAGIGAGFLFLTVIAVVFVLVMMAISKEL